MGYDCRPSSSNHPEEKRKENGDVQAERVLVQKATFCGKLYVAQPENCAAD
jgi:hypothetical protein